MRETGLLEDLSIDGRIMNCNLKEWNGRMWSGLMDQDGGKWRAVANTVMNLRVP